MNLFRKGDSNVFWIIIGAILALVALVLLIYIFSSKTGAYNVKSKNITDGEISGLVGGSCESIVLGRTCFSGSCPTNYREVPEYKSDCKNKGKDVCCEKKS
ncbi:MAG: hypothetical protein QXR30_02770 [Candidatus Woesearchaeota archaeon]